MKPLAGRALLVLLIITWAISWPVIKIGVTSVAPIWFATLRYVIASVCLLAFVAARGDIALPPRPDWPLIAVSGALQMGAYSALTALALTTLPPGRASVLAFSTPIWVVPLAAWKLHENLSRPALLGVAAGVAGVIAIAAPSFDASGRHGILAYAMLLGAAAAWSVSIVFVRTHRFTATALALAPWQMLVSTLLLLPVALLVEGLPPPIDMRGLAALAYVGVFATAFAYWAVVQAGRQFPASTMSMALLATPSLGILISALMLGETIEASLIIGVVLTGAGIRLATRSPAQPVRR